MTKRLLPLVLCTSALLLTACGPSVMVTRMGYYPPKAPSCQVEVINDVTSAPTLFAMPNSPYEIIGSIVMGDNRAGADPFSPEYIAVFQPRVCALGGDAISLMMSSSTGTMMMGGTGTGYAVLRKRGSAPRGTFVGPAAAH